MTKTERIQSLLRTIARQGYWTEAEWNEVREITEMGREPGYMPEGTEDWMAEDGVPRAYDKPRPPMHTHELPLKTEWQEVELSLTPVSTTPPPPASDDARIKTLEATVTDMMRRLKALEERTLDPSS